MCKDPDASRLAVHEYTRREEGGEVAAATVVVVGQLCATCGQRETIAQHGAATGDSDRRLG